MSSTKSWFVTLIPLIGYLLGFAFTFVTKTDLSLQQAEMLQGLLYAFLGAGTIGATKAAVTKFAINK